MKEDEQEEETVTFVGEPMSVREFGEMLLRGMYGQELKEGDLVEVTATAMVVSVEGERCILMLHGEHVPFLTSQCKRLPKPPEEE